MESLRTFARRHPLAIDALLWAIPALLFGALLRILLTSYLPYAYWNADSRSFYTFTQKFVQHSWLSLGDKRRYLYPLLLLPISYLPGGVLRWLPILQHTFGLITLVPLAYVVRRTMVFWKVWIIPVTVIYAGLPLVLWCEHELLGDHLFFALFIWTFAGWMAWVTQSTVARAGRMFWLFLVPLALFIITKPHGRFVWPGLLIGLCIVKAWKYLRWPHWTALALVLVITPTVGSNKQGAWLFYDAAFPLTRLDTPLHAEYKALMRERVERFRNHLDIYHAEQEHAPISFSTWACRRWSSMQTSPPTIRTISTMATSSSARRNTTTKRWPTRKAQSASPLRFRHTDRFRLTKNSNTRSSPRPAH